MRDLLARLGDLVGDAHVRAGSETEAIDGMIPAAVVAPGEVAQAQELVRFARAERLALIPLGAGTKRGLGAPPSRYQVGVASERLNAVRDYDFDNLTLTVGAGATLAQLAPLLAERRQCLPFDGPFGGRASLGGVAATNSTGAKRFAHKAPRDLIVGMSAVLGTGAFVQAGGKVVKNVSGFDLNKLLVGAFGTLGLVTELTVRVAPQPESTAACLAPCGSIAEAAALARRVLDSFLIPSAVVLCDRTTSRQLLELDAACALLVDFAGIEVAVEQQVARVIEWSGGRRVDHESLAQIWARVNDFGYEPEPERVAPAAHMLSWKAGVPPGGCAEFLSAAAAGEASCRALAHFSTGLVFGWFSADHEAELRAALERLRSQAAAVGGYAIVLCADPAVKRAVGTWGPTRSDFALMRGIKQTFDPDGVFSPGRFVGGL